MAFAAIYFIWGSTYLGIKYAIETIPPFLMAGIRNFSPGLFLFIVLKLRGEPSPERSHWRDASIIGALLLLGGNGLVTWAESYVPSGLAALLVATVPLWMSVINGFYGDKLMPTRREIVSILLGLCGLAVLIGPEEIIGGGRIHTLGAFALIAATLLWSFGSLFSRRAHLPSSPMMTVSIEMMAGGGLLLILAVFTGDWHSVQWSAVSQKSILAIIYLCVFGSLLGFTAYIWLLKHVAPNKVATYAYVNPIVAVLLGALMGGEELTVRTLVSAGIIILAVVLMTIKRTTTAQEKKS